MKLDPRSLRYLWHSNYTKKGDNVIINGFGEKISPSLLLVLFPIKRTVEADQNKTAAQRRSHTGLALNLLHAVRNLQGRRKTLNYK